MQKKAISHQPMHGFESSNISEKPNRKKKKAPTFIFLVNGTGFKLAVGLFSQTD